MKKLPPAVSRLLDLSAKPMTAQDMPTFLAGVRSTAVHLHNTITGDVSTDGQVALTSALEVAKRDPKHRRVLELAAWPIFDKPGLPLLEGRPQEFLWLFAMPVLVQLPEGWGELLMLPGDFLRTGDIVDRIEAAGCLNNPDAITSGFASLYSREDLHAMGPQGLAASFYEAETVEDAGLPLPLPLVVDPDIESARTVLLHVLLGVRLPAGDTDLFNPQATWPLADINAIILEDLRSAGISAESVSCSGGCSMAEAAFRCAGPGLLEMASWVKLGVAHYSIANVQVVLPVDGVAELVGVTAEGAELLLAPSFTYVEPQQELEDTVRRMCKAYGLGFNGMFSAAIQSTARLH